MNRSSSRLDNDSSNSGDRRIEEAQYRQPLTSEDVALTIALGSPMIFFGGNIAIRALSEGAYVLAGVGGLIALGGLALYAGALVRG